MEDQYEITNMAYRMAQIAVTLSEFKGDFNCFTLLIPISRDR